MIAAMDDDRSTNAATDQGLESHSNLVGSVPPHLDLREGESVILALRPSPAWVVLVNKIVTLGMYSFWWRRTGFVLTTQRLIYRRGLVNTIERSLPLRFVQDATVVTRWYGVAGVRVSTAGGVEGFEQLSPLDPRAARALRDALVSAAHATWPSSQAEPAPTSDFTDLLRKLADLRDSGVLTEEEFATKKAEILATSPEFTSRTGEDGAE